MTFEVTKGSYWHARQPSGKWCVFWTHPDYDGWHKVIAEFASEDRAESYATCENDLLDGTSNDFGDERKQQPPKLLPPPPGPVVPVSDRNVYRAIVNDLPTLLQQYPQGVTSGTIMSRYNIRYDDATAVLRSIHQAGLAKWVYLDGTGKGKTLVSNETPERITDLTIVQERMLNAMARNADKHACCSKPYGELADDAGIKCNSVSAVLYALEKKGYIMLAKPAALNGSSPATYQVLRGPGVVRGSVLTPQRPMTNGAVTIEAQS